MSTQGPATLVEVLRQHAQSKAEHRLYTFLTDGEGEGAHIDCGELDRQARAVAVRLQAELHKGDRVLLLYPPGLDFVVGFLGCLYAGMVAVPAYPPASKRHLPRLVSIVRDSSPRAVLSTEAMLKKVRRAAQHLPELKQSLWLAETDRGEAGDWRDPDIRPEELAFIQYTSGSTAEPKGVMIGHGNLMANEEAIRRSFGLDSHSVIVGWLPLYHDMGLIGNLLQPLVLGARCVFMAPVAFLQRPARWLQAITRFRATTSGGPNFAYDLCCQRIPESERADLDLSSWSLAYNGSEPVRAQTLERFSRSFAPYGFRPQALYPCYGLAEATLLVSGGDPRQSPSTLDIRASALEQGRAELASTPGDGQRLVSSGQVAAGHQVRIVEPADGRTLSDRQVGEIWVQGPSVAAGYWQQAELSARTFSEAGGTEPLGATWLRTGDLGFLDQGELYVTGRIKDLIILRGRNHYPQDLEATAEAAHPDVRAAGTAAFAIDQEGEEGLVLVAECNRHADRDPLAAAEAIRQAIAAHHEVRVTDVVLIRTGTLAKTSSGKVQRSRCRQQYVDGTLVEVARSTLDQVAREELLGAELHISREALLERSETERQDLIRSYLRERAARLLRLPEQQIGDEQALTALGLDSLSAVELSNNTQESLGVELPLELLLAGASLQEASQTVAEGLSEEGESPTHDDSLLTEQTPDTGDHPVNEGQRALWYLHRLAPNSTAYHLLGAGRLHGQLDMATLERALAHLVQEHPALRSTFPMVDGEPLARVHEELQPQIQVLQAAPGDDATQLMGEALRQPFDLETGPLLRLVVLQEAAPEDGAGIKTTALGLALHHIVGDFWSVALMLRQLSDLYRRHDSHTVSSRAGSGAETAAELLGPVAVESPAASPASFARWQARQLDGAAGERLWRFWQAQLEGELPLLDLPTDRPRPALQTFSGEQRQTRWAAQLGQLLRARAADAGSTPFHVALAAFYALLSRAAGQAELVLGVPAALRDRPQLAGTMGYLVHPVPVRVSLEEDPSVTEMLATVRQRALAATAHRAYPFGRLVEKLRMGPQGPAHDPSRPPLFQAMFVWHQDLPGLPGLAPFLLGDHDARLPLGGCELSPVAIPPGGAQVDLGLTLALMSDGSLGAILEGNSDLYDGSTLERLLQHLGVLMRGLLEQPQLRLSSLPLISPTQRQQLLTLWRQQEPGDVRSRAGDKGQRLDAFLSQQAQTQPQHTALVDGKRRLSYRELDTAVNRLAMELQRRGLQPEDRVAVLAERRAEMVVALLATLRAGGTYVPLDPAYPAQRLAFILQDSQVRLLLSYLSEDGGEDKASTLLLESESAGRLVGADTRLDLRDWNIVDPQPDPGPPAVELREEQLAYLIYTSGSTGRPKGVAISHRNAAALLHWARGAFTAAELSGVLASTSVCFDLSIFEIFVPLAWGGTVILADNALALPGLEAADEVSLVNTVPSAMAELAEALPSSVRTVCLAGEPLSRSLVDRLHQAGVQRVLDLYGPSEDTTYSTYAEAEVGSRREPAIGRPVDGTQAYVADRGLRLRPWGYPGEILLAGDGLARGYLGRPALTALRFVPNPWSNEAGDRIYRTGDLGRIGEGDDLDYLGRLDHQVKIRGFRIELGEIETAAREHPEVEDVAAVATVDNEGDALLALYWVPAGRPEGSTASPVPGQSADGDASTPEDLRPWLAQRLPAFMLPQALIPLQALPRTPNGKLDRKALPAPSSALFDRETSNFVAPETEVEQILAEIWCEVLGLEQVGIQDSFFELGGHSLKATRVLAKVHELFGVELPVRSLLESPTIAGLEEAIAERLMAEADEETLAEALAELD